MRNRFDLTPARALAGASVPARVAASAAALALALGCIALPARAGTMTVALNHSARLKLAGPAASVVVGNPSVADVTVVDSRTVFVTGHGPGSTDVAVLDPLGRTLFSGDVRVTVQPGAHVTVHRGASVVSDVACDPTCVAVTPGAGGTAGRPSPLASGALAGALAGAFGGAMSEAASNAAQRVPSATTASLLGPT